MKRRKKARTSVLPTSAFFTFSLSSELGEHDAITNLLVFNLHYAISAVPSHCTIRDYPGGAWRWHCRDLTGNGNVKLQWQQILLTRMEIPCTGAAAGRQRRWWLLRPRIGSLGQRFARQQCETVLEITVPCQNRNSKLSTTTSNVGGALADALEM